MTTQAKSTRPSHPDAPQPPALQTTPSRPGQARAREAATPGLARATAMTATAPPPASRWRGEATPATQTTLPAPKTLPAPRAARERREEGAGPPGQGPVWAPPPLPPRCPLPQRRVGLPTEAEARAAARTPLGRPQAAHRKERKWPAPTRGAGAAPPCPAGAPRRARPTAQQGSGLPALTSEAETAELRRPHNPRPPSHQMTPRGLDQRETREAQRMPEGRAAPPRPEPAGAPLPPLLTSPLHPGRARPLSETGDQAAAQTPLGRPKAAHQPERRLPACRPTRGAGAAPPCPAGAPRRARPRAQQGAGLPPLTSKAETAGLRRPHAPRPPAHQTTP